MMQKTRLETIALAALVAVACTSRPPTAPAPARDRDLHSFARPEEARVTHVALDLRADFQAKRLSGTATLSIERIGNASTIVLDVRDLIIERVTDPGGQSLGYHLGAIEPALGRPLTIELPPGLAEVVIRYQTRPEAAALQWLSPEQTAGRRQPYLFSQGQAILTRTWIPTQDSPAIRQTYSANITVPAGLRAVMSAEQLTPEGHVVGDERLFEFRMREAIPPYLFALAVGDIGFRALGPRSGVYAEPAVLDKAAYELADVEKMIEAAERLGGPYRWGRYDVLVLPPSFPYGGMENPRLTFATPTMLAGDRSLTSLIAHELAHSWSGNLVTNATWRDFWLNEGLTTYFEHRIVESLYGREQAVMLQALGRQELQDEMARLGATSPDTVLHIDLAGRDPDAGFTTVPYEKGSAFFHLLEAAAGRERFDTFLRSYFDRRAFQSITTTEFAGDLRATLLGGEPAIEGRVGVDEWLNQPGLPSNAPALASVALSNAERQAARFAQGEAANALDTRGWTTQQWQRFLGLLPATMARPRLSDLDRAFGFTRTSNSEILFSWLRIAIRNRYAPALSALEQFLTSQGRRKFLRPLYEDLMAADWGKAEARRIYAKARPLYHPVATATLDQIVR